MKNQKRERFVKIAEARTNKIIKMIRLLSNCSNKSAYEYDEDEVKKIFGTLERELRQARMKFTQNGKDRFTL
ncbi:MAG: hypothetical protein ACE5GV_17010 [Candidatus Scalindua sp.]